MDHVVIQGPEAININSRCPSNAPAIALTVGVVIIVRMLINSSPGTEDQAMGGVNVTVMLTKRGSPNLTMGRHTSINLLLITTRVSVSLSTNLVFMKQVSI